MSHHPRTVAVMLLLVSDWVLSGTLAFAQTTAQELEAAKVQAAPSPVVCGTDENGSGTGTAEYIQVYISTNARWCVDATFWPANAQYISQFFAYYDGVVTTLRSLFNVNIPLPVLMEVRTPTPGGFVCACGPIFGQPIGIRMTGDAFSNTFSNPQSNQSIPGFWGYLLTVHETINAFTGQVSGGWPTDWWADDISPFPNAMDELVMRDIGTSQNNQTLLNAASAQHERFVDPSQAGYSPEVAMFESFYNQYGGFPAYSKFFSLIQNDVLQWGTVAQCPKCLPDHNYSENLSEYVIAYLSLAFGAKSDLTPTFAKAGVGNSTSWSTNGTILTTTPYTLNSTAIKGVADAHCAIRAASAAGLNVTSQLTLLQQGNYQNVAVSGGTSSSCPSECSWTQNRCAAKW
jgi:hypothetical protein